MRPAKSRKYEYINSRGCYRKRIRDLDGKYHALYAKTVKEMDEKVRAFKLWDFSASASVTISSQMANLSIAGSLLSAQSYKSSLVVIS